MPSFPTLALKVSDVGDVLGGGGGDGGSGAGVGAGGKGAIPSALDFFDNSDAPSLPQTPTATRKTERVKSGMFPPLVAPQKSNGLAALDATDLETLVILYPLFHHTHTHTHTLSPLLPLLFPYDIFLFTAPLFSSQGAVKTPISSTNTNDYREKGAVGFLSFVPSLEMPPQIPSSESRMTFNRKETASLNSLVFQAEFSTDTCNVILFDRASRRASLRSKISRVRSHPSTLWPIVCYLPLPLPSHKRESR